MEKVNIPFRDDMKLAILNGKKTCTSRNKRYGYIGDQFEIDGQKFVLTWVSHVYLDDVAHLKYQDEGFESPNQFIEVWNQIHPRKGFDPLQTVWLHEFKKAL